MTFGGGVGTPQGLSVEILSSPSSWECSRTLRNEQSLKISLICCQTGMAETCFDQLKVEEVSMTIPGEGKLQFLWLVLGRE